ncbi:branched-chain amino acid ABC transporter permease [Pusillimonas sp. ANT_WB101]|uniref:branched-chain amino acid ABC transporter permease n=1 Tax=Pusillimonas sp. ANT_WB101 TaxID=2597356 RepID=UPI001CAA86BF|nr:branched-chain amino acid ABC transporter permease [Pusillimonas sp. ANT_WB101]
MSNQVMTDITSSSCGKLARQRLRIVWAVVFASLLAYPLLVPDFWVVSVGAQSLILGMIALSLTFLAAYGGMVSLAQMAVAGVAGYTLAILSSHSANVGVEVVPWPVALLLGMLAGIVAGLVIGAIAVRSRGIYLLMSTLAISMIFYYLAQQNTTVLYGFDGIRGIAIPTIMGASLREPSVFYYLCLAVAGLAYLMVVHLVRTPFGLALQGARDDEQRMRSLGFRVTLHQVAAFGVAGLLASLGGILNLWYQGGISPGSIGMTSTIGILIMAVIGGLSHPRGAFIGALAYVLIQTFAVDIVGANRFNTLIGSVFLIIVMLSPDGLAGVWRRLFTRRVSEKALPSVTSS